MGGAFGAETNGNIIVRGVVIRENVAGYFGGASQGTGKGCLFNSWLNNVSPANPVRNGS